MKDTVRLHLNWSGWYVEQIAPPSKVREIRAAFDIDPDAPCLLPLPHPASAPRAYVESRLRAVRPDATIAGPGAPMNTPRTTPEQKLNDLLLAHR